MDVKSEKRLLRAILSQALSDYRKPKGKKKDKDRIKREATAWFRSDKTGLHSFVWLCQALDLHPDKTRSMILT